MAETPDYYEILQVHPRASLLVIKKAYRTLLLSGGHPDLGGSKTEAQLLTEAYEVLSDPDRRMAYDRSRGHGRLAPATILISICPHCGVFNRVRSETKLLIARCGKCGQAIGKVSAPTRPLRSRVGASRKRQAWTIAAVALILVLSVSLGVALWADNRDPLQEALELEERGQLSTAAERLEAVVVKEPRNALAHQRLGRIYEGQRQLDQAIRSYRQAVELEPKLAQARLALGRAQMRRGLFNEAEDELVRAVRLDPQDVSALVQLAKLRIKTGRLGEGIATYRVALPLDPRNAELRYGLAVVCQMKGQLADAERAYRDTLRLEPRHREALIQLGSLLAGRGAYPEALHQFHEAINLQYEDAELHFRIAEAYRLASDLPNAMRELQVASGQAKSNPMLKGRIDRALQVLGG